MREDKKSPPAVQAAERAAQAAMQSWGDWECKGGRRREKVDARRGRRWFG